MLPAKWSLPTGDWPLVEPTVVQSALHHQYQLQVQELQAC